MPEQPLPTVDLEGVEIAAAGVTVFGGGSPKGGDTYSVDDLEAIAKASNAVCEDLRPPVKLGHDRQQRLLRASGLWGEQPRTGTLRNFRVVGDKLVTDVRDVPRKLADLVRSGAFRVRSMELGPTRSQRTNEVYPRTVKALALLGATTPAFQTLDDIHAVYAGDDRANTQELFFADQSADFTGDKDLVVVDYAVGDVVWDEEDGVRDIMDDVSVAINGPGDGPARYWVQDLQLMDVDGDGDVPGPRALVQEYGSGAAWVVPLTFDSAGEPVVPPSSEWTLAQQAWVQADPGSGDGDAPASTPTVETDDADYASRERGGSADTSRQMPTKPKDTQAPQRPDLDEGQVKFFADLLGLEAEDDAEIDAGKVFAALETKLGEQPAPPAPPDGGDPPTPPTPPPPKQDDNVRMLSEDEFQTLRSMAERGAAAAEALRVKERHDTIIEGGVKAGKLDPSAVKMYEERFDQDPELIKSVIDSLPVQESLLKVYGADADGLDQAGATADEDIYRAYCASQGIPYLPARIQEQVAG